MGLFILSVFFALLFIAFVVALIFVRSFREDAEHEE